MNAGLRAEVAKILSKCTENKFLHFIICIPLLTAHVVSLHPHPRKPSRLFPESQLAHQGVTVGLAGVQLILTRPS